MSDSEQGWVKLFHPSGAMCTLPLIPGASEEYAGTYPKVLFDEVNALIAAGFLVNAPGLEEGEQKEEIGYVLRKEHTHEGETTWVIAAYSTNPALTWKVMHKYINEDADQVAFEKASGMRLTDLPIWIGGDYPERGKSPSADKFIVKVPRPFFVVWKNNPKHLPPPPEGQKDQRTATQKMTKLFVRWEAGTGSAKQEPTLQQDSKSVKDEATILNEEVTWWKRYLDKDPSLDELTDNFHRWMKRGWSKEIQTAVREEAFGPWKATTGCWYDPDAKRWMPPKEPESEYVPF